MLIQFLVALMVAFPTLAGAVNLDSEGRLELKVLSYNVKCLPFPEKCTKAKMRRIGEILQERRKSNTHPDVVLLQEGFVGDFKKLLKAAGYKYALRGPNSSELNPHESGHRHLKVVGSGLWILTDLPILRTAKRAFKSKDCTSWDCYSNKGLLLADIKISDEHTITFVTTHMNSGQRKKTEKMRGRQLIDVREFLEEHHAGQLPMIFAGDFNLDPKRDHFQPLHEITKATNMGRTCLDSASCKISESTPLELVFEETVDHHLVRAGDAHGLQPLFLERNFQEKIEDEELSDHLGYEVHYKIIKK